MLSFHVANDAAKIYWLQIMYLCPMIKLSLSLSLKNKERIIWYDFHWYQKWGKLELFQDIYGPYLPFNT